MPEHILIFSPFAIVGAIVIWSAVRGHLKYRRNRDAFRQYARRSFDGK